MLAAYAKKNESNPAMAQVSVETERLQLPMAAASMRAPRSEITIAYSCNPY